jgi:hypothetical protein
MFERPAAAIAVVLLIAVTSCTSTKAPTPTASAAPSASSRGVDPHFALTASAATLETTGRVGGFETVALDGTFLLAGDASIDGRVRRILVEGGPVVLDGPGLGILSRATVIDHRALSATGDPMPPHSAYAQAGPPRALPRIFFAGGARIRGTHLTVDGRPTDAPVTSTASGSLVLYGVARVAPAPSRFAIAEDSSNHSRRAAVATPTLLWWRGTGSVAMDGTHYSGRSVTLIASTLAVTGSLDGAMLALAGTGTATQVAVEGRPRLRTTLVVKGTPPARLTRGSGEQMLWTEENDGPWEAIVTSIRPLDTPAGWVRLSVDTPLALDGDPPAFAGTAPRCTEAGGAFAEDYLCAQLAPGQAVDSPLIVNPPTLQASGRFDARFEVSGNFPTVVVTVPFTVTPR